MDPDKTFCLKWNNFQQNIFSTIRNLRLDLDFLDVTIFCKGRQMKAHKVILSACSNTFKSILKETQAPHPVIVLWDIEARDVSALLDFMYNGQVDIQQDDLERFLIVADRLQVRGLSGEETESDSRKRNLAAVNNAFKPAKAARKESRAGQQGGGGGGGTGTGGSTNSDHVVIHNHHPQTGDLDVDLDVDIKTEVVEDSGSNHKAPLTNSNIVSLPQRSPPLVHSALGPIKKRNLNSTEEYIPETVEYPGDNGDFPAVEQNDNYEEFYDEEVAYNNTAQYPIDYSMDNSPGKSSKSVKCPYCEKVLKYRHNLKGHIQNQHGAGEPEAPCPICPDKIFKNSASLRDHMSRKHRGEKAAVAAAQQQQQQQQQQQHLSQQQQPAIPLTSQTGQNSN